MIYIYIYNKHNNNNNNSLFRCLNNIKTILLIVIKNDIKQNNYNKRCFFNLLR